jgi:hypothetical protein
MSESKLPPEYVTLLANHSERIYELERRQIVINADDWHFLHGSVTQAGAGTSVTTLDFTPVGFAIKPIFAFGAEADVDPGTVTGAAGVVYAWTISSTGLYTGASLRFYAPASANWTFHCTFMGFV